MIGHLVVCLQLICGSSVRSIVYGNGAELTPGSLGNGFFTRADLSIFEFLLLQICLLVPVPRYRAVVNALY